MSCDHGHRDPDQDHDFRPLGPPHREPTPTQARQDRARSQRQRMLDLFEHPQAQAQQAQRELAEAQRALANARKQVGDAQQEVVDAQAAVDEAQAAVDKTALVECLFACSACVD